jgi:amino acid transporter
VVALLRNELDAFIWWANSLAFFALITYVATNAAAIAYFARLQAHRFRWPLHGLGPVIGIGSGFDSYLLYRGFFKSLWGARWRTSQRIVVLGITLAALGAAWGVLVHLQRRELPGSGPQPASPPTAPGVPASAAAPGEAR